MNELQSKLESILFVASKPTATTLLVKLTGAPEDEVTTALRTLSQSRAGSGIVVMEANGQWQLGTNPQNVDLVKAFLTADLREKLTDATVEVLGIIAYRQPISKSEIEAIRGVNCQYSIRQLLMRGLIEKVSNPNDSRSNLYQVTTEFLQHMGLTSVADLPEFAKLTENIKLPETPQTKTPDTAGIHENSSNAPITQPQTHKYADPTGIHVPEQQPKQVPNLHTEPVQSTHLQPQEVTEAKNEAPEYKPEEDDEF